MRALPLICLAACLATAGSAAAQGGGFDLTSQRLEKQNVQRVPGRPLNHHGWLLNPTPHKMKLDTASGVDVGGGVRVRDRRGAFADALSFVARGERGTRLAIDFGERAAARGGVRPVPGAYALRVGRGGIDIVGYDERGAFYGLQTLRQMMESEAARGGRIPHCEIEDWPDLPWRGVVEGFYGPPWSHEVRLSLIEFYGRMKMDTYIYGPKDDPYHSSPNWRLPYPDKEARDIGELIAACRRNRVDFVWAIHPGQDIRWDDEDYGNLVRKFEHMYGLGVRHFAIFFDDISGDGTDPVRQAELLNRLSREFVSAKGDVGPLTVCPTDYSKLWANPTPQGSLAVYGKTLREDVKVFWTGDVVCSDLTTETLDFVDSRIGRPAFYWWNYPVTDYARNYLLQGPVYGLDTTLTDAQVCGIVSNPMEHGEASKLALYGVADYAWNVAAYNPIDNWERGLVALMPGVGAAYRTFAIHSCDTETGYRRDESWETTTFRLSEWTDAAAELLERDFEAIEAAPGEIEARCANRALVGELRPWLDEMRKLGRRGGEAIDLARLYRRGADDATLWGKYQRCIMTDREKRGFDAHKVGTMKLQPFFENMMDDIGHAFLARLLGHTPKDYKAIGSFANSAASISKLMFDNDSATYYTSGISQKEGDWIGVDLRDVRDVGEVFILQGRNSVDDVDFFDHATLECSADGRAWTPLIADLAGQYEVRWRGNAVRARYVRLRRLDSRRRNYASVRTFEVNPLRLGNLGFSVEAADTASALRAFDHNLATWHAVDPGGMTIGVPAGAKSVTLLLDDAGTPPACKVVGADGALLREEALSRPLAIVELPQGAAGIKIEGEAKVYEIIPNLWPLLTTKTRR